MPPPPPPHTHTQNVSLLWKKTVKLFQVQLKIQKTTFHGSKFLKVGEILILKKYLELPSPFVLSVHFSLKIWQLCGWVKLQLYSIGFRVFSFLRIISLNFINKIVIFKGNHGEDVKECYYYLDSTPTHSYMKALYKYPQNEYPYSWLVNENRRRSRQDPEFELCDTGRRILLHYSVNSEFFFTKPAFLHSPKILVLRIKPLLDALKHLALATSFPWNFNRPSLRLPLVFSLNPIFSVA